jgi:hypothetical protein
MRVIQDSKINLPVKSPTLHNGNLNTQASIGREPFDNDFMLGIRSWSTTETILQPKPL